MKDKKDEDTEASLFAGRTPTDGKPYYCIVCGLGFGEFMACEEIGCALESEDTAKLRAALTSMGPQ